MFTESQHDTSHSGDAGQSYVRLCVVALLMSWMCRIGAAFGLSELGWERLSFLPAAGASVRQGCEEGDQQSRAQREQGWIFIRKQSVRVAQHIDPDLLTEHDQR